MRCRWKLILASISGRRTLLATDPVTHLPIEEHGPGSFSTPDRLPSQHSTKNAGDRRSSGCGNPGCLLIDIGPSFAIIQTDTDEESMVCRGRRSDRGVRFDELRLRGAIASCSVMPCPLHLKRRPSPAVSTLLLLLECTGLAHQIKWAENGFTSHWYSWGRSPAPSRMV